MTPYLRSWRGIAGVGALQENPYRFMHAVTRTCFASATFAYCAGLNW